MDYLFDIETLSAIGTVAGGFMLGSKCGECQYCCKCDGCFNNVDTFLVNLTGSYPVPTGYEQNGGYDYYIDYVRDPNTIFRTYRYYKLYSVETTYPSYDSYICTYLTCLHNRCESYLWDISNFYIYYYRGKLDSVSFPFSNVGGNSPTSDNLSYSTEYGLLSLTKGGHYEGEQWIESICSSGYLSYKDNFRNIDNTGTGLMDTLNYNAPFDPSFGGGEGISDAICNFSFSTTGYTIYPNQKVSQYIFDSSGLANTRYPTEPVSNPLNMCQCKIMNTGASGVFTYADPGCTIDEEVCVECWRERVVSPYYPNFDPYEYTVDFSGGYVDMVVCDVAPIIVSVSLSGVPHFSDLSNSYELDWIYGFWYGSFKIADSNTDNNVDYRLIELKVTPLLGKLSSYNSGVPFVCSGDYVNYFIEVDAKPSFGSQSFSYKGHTNCRPRICHEITDFSISKTIPYYLPIPPENNWYYYIGSGTPPTGLNITVSYNV
jgi:hypothetical protein